MLYRSQLSHKIILQWKQYNVHTRLVNNVKQVPLRQYHLTNNLMGIPENVKDKRKSILEEKQRIPPSLWQDWGAHHWQSHKQILHTQDNDGLSRSSLISYFQMQEPIHKVQLIIWTDVELKQTPRSLLFYSPPSTPTNKTNLQWIDNGTWTWCPHSLMTFRYFPVVKIVPAIFARKLGIPSLRL